MRFSQLPGKFRMTCCNLSCQMEQRLQPEVRHIEYFMALFHESNRQQKSGELVFGTQFRRGASQQHRFSSAARSNDQDMLARRRFDVPMQYFEHGIELAVSDHELIHHFLVGL